MYYDNLPIMNAYSCCKAWWSHRVSYSNIND